MNNILKVFLRKAITIIGYYYLAPPKNNIASLTALTLASQHSEGHSTRPILIKLLNNLIGATVLSQVFFADVLRSTSPRKLFGRKYSYTLFNYCMRLPTTKRLQQAAPSVVFSLTLTCFRSQFFSDFRSQINCSFVSGVTVQAY